MTNLYDTLKDLCATNEWGFFYGRRDFQNLFEDIEDNDKVYLFLDPIVIDGVYNEYNALIENKYSGTFMLLKSSELDEGYDERYQTDIKPLIQSKLTILWNELSDLEYEISNLRTTEVINVLDFGYDGVIINYSLTHRNDDQ